MTKQAITTANAPQPAGAYSQAIVANGFAYTAGFTPRNPHTGDQPEGIVAQTHQVLDNIVAVLSELGLTLDDVVKSTVHLADLHRDIAAFNDAYASRFSAPFPVRTTVGSTLGGFLVEIDVVAVLRT